MNNFTTNKYQMKRKICDRASKTETKFVTDMIYGISKSKDIKIIFSKNRNLNE